MYLLCILYLLYCPTQKLDVAENGSKNIYYKWLCKDIIAKHEVLGMKNILDI